MTPDASPVPRRAAPTQPRKVTPIELARLRNACSMCSLRELCLPAGLGPMDINTVDRLINRRRSVAKGGYLYRANAPLQALYAIRGGFMKTCLPHPDGGEQVAGFHMPGDLLGLDAIGAGRHMCDAAALENCEICDIPLDTLEQLSRRIPALRQHFHRILSREIVRDHHMMLLLANMRAEERLAAFLLNLSQRYAARGYSATEFILRMTRADIGSYLGLTIETVSRALSHLRREQCIEVHARRVRIINVPRLKSAAGRAGAAQPT
jgi:CRP/FNR family transcriptional regulator, anaerobic regulatory protein